MSPGLTIAVTPLDQPTTPPARVSSGIGEIDRVLGGGIVAGSVVLVGGEPGVGKSTLLLQLAGRIALHRDAPVLYVTGEESAAQLAMRAERLGVPGSSVMVIATGSMSDVSAAVVSLAPGLVIIDSVQTMTVPESDGAPGGVSQVRAVGTAAAAIARRHEMPVMLVGHVTKDGSLAGPKVLEHLVDVTLVIEGDADRGLRYVRSIKNRHGSVDQVGVFEMQSAGMVEVEDPTGVFVTGWSGSVPGTVLYPAMFGRRTMLIEVQALVVPSGAPQPRRSVKGVHPARVHQLLAVLERRGSISCSDHEVYVNIVGGLSIQEPAVDLAIALSIASARLDCPLGAVAAFGEVGLVGEVRAVSNAERRTAEITRFGIEQLIAPPIHDGIVAALGALGMAPQPSQRPTLTRV